MLGTLLENTKKKTKHPSIYHYCTRCCYEVLSFETQIINHNMCCFFLLFFPVEICNHVFFSRLFNFPFFVPFIVMNGSVTTAARTAHEVFGMQNGGSYQLHFDNHESNTIVMQTIIQRREHTAIRRKTN